MGKNTGMSEDKIAKKRHREQYVVSQMVEIYCHGNHGTKGEMCDECKEIAEYAKSRSEHCPFMENKTFCANCKVHCYKPEMREKIKKVMRYSGPRIMFYHPFMAVWHVITSKKEKSKINKEQSKAS